MTATVRELTKQVVSEEPRPTYRACAYCGWPCVGLACHSHRDLVALERDLYTQSDKGA